MDSDFVDDRVGFCHSADYQKDGLFGGVEHQISPYAKGNGV
jgi:hypothetical protein